MTDRRVALVTGANKGLGLEIARRLGGEGLTVVLGARDADKAEAAAERLRAASADAHAVRLDVTDTATLESLAAWLEQRFGRLDVLVNNAGIQLDPGVQPSELDLGALRQTFETNVIGAWAVTQAVLPLIRRSDAGRIVNMASALGSLTGIVDPAWEYHHVVAPAYQASKTAMNAMTALFARELADTPVKINSACPGWVRTDMGTDRAPLSVEEGADTPVWLATLPADGPSGGFFRARQRVAW